MNFPETYFEDEVVAGYFIDARMKCCWAATLEVLQVIDKICKKYNIPYFAEWGTLLGTVRHGGFIPWDDDMDICMKRPDYERFVKVLERELPKGYDYLNYHNQEDYWDVMTRVVNSSEINYKPEFLDKYHNMPYVVGVDIFPLDYLARDKKLVQTQKDLVEYVKSVADVNGTQHMEPEELEYHLLRIEELCNQKIDRQKSIKDQLYKIVCSLYAIYGERESDEIALMPLYLENGGCVYPKSYFQDSIRMPFENMTMPVPIGYDDILKKKYGDYMKNVRKGGSHDYPYFEAQEEFLIEKDVNLPTYQYPRDWKKSKLPTFRQDIDRRMDLLAQVHEKVGMLLGVGELELALQCLEKCQELAIGMGRSIEKKVGEGSETVTCLEKYCEAVFQIYEVLGQGNVLDGAAVKGMLDKLIHVVKISFENLQIKKEIVFMPYHVAHWRMMEPLWKEAVSHEENDVKVVPLPYFYKKIWSGEVGEAHCDRDDFPEYVPITMFEDYDVQNNHPDVIVIQNPWDEWNYTVTVHTNYYAEVLQEQCEELIYIPWFKLDEMNPEDGRGLKSRKYFVPMPGLVYADKVYLQSEGMKESYIDYLCQWAGEDTKEVWEEKITAAPRIYDIPEEAVPRPAEWGDKKVLIYHISGNGLMEHKQKMLDKIRNSLYVFEKQAEHIQIVWLQDAMLRERLEKRIPATYREYKHLVNQARDKSWITIVEAEERTKWLAMADAYYGDAGRNAQAMRERNKPVMLQNVDIS